MTRARVDESITLRQLRIVKAAIAYVESVKPVPDDAPNGVVLRAYKRMRAKYEALVAAVEER